MENFGPRIFVGFAILYGMTPLSKTQDSWIGWLFLFATTVLLPLLIADQAIQASIRASAELRREDLRSELRRRATQAPRLYDPAQVLLNIQDRLRKGTLSKTMRTVRHLEKEFPGAFRWLFWDIDGNPVEVPDGLGLPSKNLWKRVIREYFRRPDYTHELFRGRPSFSPLLSNLQSFLGPKTRVDLFLQSGGAIIPANISGKLAWLFWMCPSEQNVTEWPSGGGPVGSLIMVFPDRLPGGFWEKAALQGISQIPLEPFSPIAMTDTMHPEASRLDRGLLRNRQFFERLENGLRLRVSDIFSIDSWYAIPLKFTSRASIHAFLFADFAPILQEEQTRSFFGRMLIGFFLFAGCSVYIAFFKGAGTSLPLRLRISGFFALAILLPITGLFYSCYLLVIQEEAVGKLKATSALRSSQEFLRELYREFPRWYGRRMMDVLGGFGGIDASETILLKTLNGVMGRGLLSNYYLSDNRGKLVAMGNSPTQGSLLGGIKLLLHKTFGDIFAGIEEEKPLAGMAYDEMSDMVENSSTTPTNTVSNAPGTEFKRYSMYRSQFYGMILPIRINRQPRILFLNITEDHMQRAFAIDENRQRRFSRIGSGEDWVKPELCFFSYLPNRSHIPSRAKDFSCQSVFTALSGSQECEGGYKLGKHSYCFHLASRELFNNLRPLFRCSLEPLYEKLRSRYRQFFTGSFLIILVALGLGFQLAGRLLHPIRDLDAGVTEVGKGNLHIELPVVGKDEIGRLCRNFNEMIRELREKERMRAYVSDTVMEAVRDGAVEGARRGVTREATVLFADIRNFTTISESNTPEEIFRMLNDFLGGMDAPIREFGGRIDKFIGDAVMAVFLAEQEDQALNAVRAAVAMKHILRQFNERRANEGLFIIDIGIGLNTGMVMLGDVGSDRRKDMTVIGDTVNLASRLESASKLGRHMKIVLSEATYNKVRSFVNVEEMSQTEVKGKTQSIRMFELVSLNDLAV
ncbi:MAG: adenylate/guanylate cyclase domain-containing protein [Candidatus Ozemobacteraceae bacterium]